MDSPFWVYAGVLILIAAGVYGLNQLNKSQQEQFEDVDAMQIDLDFKTEFPEAYTCDGENISPAVSFSRLPEKAETVALILDDPDAPGSTFTHWLIWNIPVGEDLKEGIPEQGVVNGTLVQGRNDFGDVGYGGPCPPGGTHNYRFRAYAVENRPELKPGASKKELMHAIKEDVVAKTEITRSYSR